MNQLPVRLALLPSVLFGMLFGAVTVCAALPAHAGKPRIAVGVCKGLDNPDEIKKAGFDYVELGVRTFAGLPDEEFETFAAKHKAAGIPTPVGNSFIDAKMAVVGPSVDLDAVKKYVTTAFQRSKRLGLKIIVFGSGGSRNVPEGFSRDEAWKQLVTLAKWMGPQAKKHGITVAVEPLRKQETNIINTAAEGLKWVKEVRHPNFQLMVDFYHLSEEKEDPAILLEARKYIKHFHFANPTGRVYPQSADEFDYAPFFANMAKMNFRGGISVEAKANDFATEGPAAAAFLKNAVAPQPRGKPAPKGELKATTN